MGRERGCRWSRRAAQGLGYLGAALEAKRWLPTFHEGEVQAEVHVLIRPLYAVCIAHCLEFIYNKLRRDHFIPQTAQPSLLHPLLSLPLAALPCLVPTCSVPRLWQLQGA